MLNFDKTSYMQFIIKYSSLADLNVGYDNKQISNTSTLSFLGIVIDNTLSWKSHVYMIVPKLSAASYAVRVLKPFMSQDISKMIYLFCFRSILSYGLIFWGNSSSSNNIFDYKRGLSEL
jgi:hypothetical protein